VHNEKINIPVLDWNKQKKSEIELNSDIFDTEYRQDIVHEVIRWQMNKKREAIQHAKNRSEVAGAHRKVWAQKETGRARQGDGKSPHWRGGGVAFGIAPRTYEFKLNKKYKSLALKSVLSHKLRNGGLMVLEDILSQDFSRTKSSKEALSRLIGSEHVLLVSNYKKEDVKGINLLEGVNIMAPIGLNVLSCCRPTLIFDRNSIAEIQGRLINE
jgi:large subunit ribosomal protein L4